MANGEDQNNDTTPEEEEGGDFDWGGVGETAGALGPLVCGFVDSCDTSAYGGQQGQQGGGKQPQQQGMGTGMKILLGVLTIAVVGTLVYLGVRNS